MPGLTAKVFRTFNASITLDDKVKIGLNENPLDLKILFTKLADMTPTHPPTHTSTLEP